MAAAMLRSFVGAMRTCIYAVLEPRAPVAIPGMGDDQYGFIVDLHADMLGSPLGAMRTREGSPTRETLSRCDPSEGDEGADHLDRVRVADLVAISRRGDEDAALHQALAAGADGCNPS